MSWLRISAPREDVNGINIDHNVNVVNMARKTTSARRDSYHHGDLKRALTSAALSLVAEKGPKGFTLTEAARRAGVSAAAPYRHFADKAELLATVAEQGFLELHADLAAAVDAVTEPKARVIELGRVYVRWAVTHRDRYQVMFGAEIAKADHPTLAVAAERAFGDLLDAITLCQEAGIVTGQDPREIAGPLWSLVHGVASLAIGGELRAVGIDQDPEAMIESVVAQLL
jgi:AcrR family transcriptional regulator